MPQNGVTISDGSFSFGGGVDSIRVSTVQSEKVPDGLPRNFLPWLVNGTVRDGGILQRTGWQPRGRIAGPAKLWQGMIMYEPDNANPYPLALVSGELLKVDPDFASPPINLTASFPGTFNPATEPQAFFVQGNRFAVVQAGDNVTLPLFWDGALLRRSSGLPGNELPAATAMDFFQGHIWYAQGRVVAAGDLIFDNGSGTAPYRYADSILKVKENPYVLGGDGFSVPDNAGNIRAVKHSANLDATLGEGNLYLGTRRAIYKLTVPLNRNDWSNLNAATPPLMTVVQLTNGIVSERSVVSYAGDLYYLSLEPAVRSLIAGVRYFNTPGQTPISANEQRILQFFNRGLMHLSSGVVFNNFLLMLGLPEQRPQGVIHKAILPLDFTPQSNFSKTLPPAWCGHWQGEDILQMVTGDFGGRERCFSAVVSSKDGGIDLWEITDSERFENGDQRVGWKITFPAFNNGEPFELKKLVSAELWVDKLYGDVEFTMEYMVDGDVCPKLWHKWKQCSARNTCEDVNNPVCYPVEPCRESFRATMTLPRPPQQCETVTGRPAYIGYQFQPVLTIKGWCRVRGIMLHAETVERKLYQSMVC